MKVYLALFLSLFPLLAQTQQTPSVEELLPRLYEYAREYRAKLPSLSCDESITSQMVKKEKVKKETRIEATLREIRDDTKSDPFTENRTFKSVDRHAPKPHFTVPFLVQGGFANGVGFAREDSEGCFEYRLASQDGGAALRLDLILKPNNADPHCKDIPEGYHKTVLVDRETGRITHVERSISAEAAKHRKEVYFASIDYGPQKLGNETFWLPAKMSAHDAADEGRMYVTYSNFHRYTGELNIVQENHPPNSTGTRVDVSRKHNFQVGATIRAGVPNDRSSSLGWSE